MFEMSLNVDAHFLSPPWVHFKMKRPGFLETMRLAPESWWLLPVPDSDFLHNVTSSGVLQELLLSNSPFDVFPSPTRPPFPLERSAEKHWNIKNNKVSKCQNKCLIYTHGYPGSQTFAYKVEAPPSSLLPHPLCWWFPTTPTMTGLVLVTHSPATIALGVVQPKDNGRS